MIIITKLYDEKYAETEYVKFRVIDKDCKKTATNIKEIFNEAKERWDDVFLAEDKITFDDSIIMNVVAQLQSYSLINSSRNVISEAFESIIAYATKGSKGQFFTPENVAKLMVKIASPTEKTTIFDPASGTASFLTTSMFYVWKQIDNTFMRSNAKYDKEQQFATNNLFGIEKDAFLAKISKAFMAVLGDGRAGIFVEDSLNDDGWKLSTVSKIKDKQFDIILTNPPFGKDVKLSEDTKARYQFDSIELAFVEHSLNHLKKGGILGIILPETIFHAPSKEAVRKAFFYNNNITHLIDLPHDTFRPYNNAKTNIIFLQKGEKQQKEVTLIKVDEIGHDHLGHEKFIFNRHTMTFTSTIADDIPSIITSLTNKEENPKIKQINFVDLKEKDLLVARPYFNLHESLNTVTLGSLIHNGIITAFDGHGSPQSHLKGLGTHPYVRVKDIVNLEVAHNRLDDIPNEEYERLFSEDKALKEKDIIFVRRGSYRIGDVGILYKKDLNSLLTRELLVLRVNDNNLGITPFNLLGLLNGSLVRNQLSNLILMDTTLPNIGSRWMNITLDISDINTLSELDSKIKEMYKKRSTFWENYADVFGENC